MNIIKYFFTLCFAVMILSSCNNIKNYPGEESLAGRDTEFDLGWKFLQDSLNGAEVVAFNDSGWRTIDLPHDWSIENLTVVKGDTVIGHFSKKSVGKTSTGYAVGGTAWYRNSFTLSRADSSKNISLHFDGVYMESDVWVNGMHAGDHKYGYTPFYFDISQYLNNPGIKNVIAVRVKNEGKNSRWYSGSGIYRHVWITKANLLHIETWGVSVCTPLVNSEKAQVDLGIRIKNNQGHAAHLTILTTIFDQDGKVVNQIETKELVSNSESMLAKQVLEMSKPVLWSPETPHLYKARIDLVQNDQLIDRQTVNFGVRSIEFTAAKGFLLNGKQIKMKGGCMHHDNGLLGSATYDRAEERRVQIMKANGFNAIRTSHNPPSKQFLDACDRIGMLVIDEAFDMWELPKNPNDYSLFFKQCWPGDLRSMILRDRNHPCVVIWSIGNEISERSDTSGVRIASVMRNCIHEIDTTRPITAAVCAFWDHPGWTWANSAPAFQNLDIGGYNYQWREYLPDHTKFPQRIMMGTESVPMEAYENWQQVKRNNWVIGDFVWTGMDYLGETGIGHLYFSDKKENYFLQPWPWFNAWCGDIDICGFKKPQSFYRDVVWEQSQIEIAVHVPLEKGIKESVSFWGWPDEQSSWTWPGNEGKLMHVKVYSQAEKVQLFLNDKLIGDKTISDTSKLTADFDVPYQAGILKAVALSKGKELGSKVLTTAGQIVAIRLTADRQVIKSNRNDLCYITVEAIDGKGNLVPNANLMVKTSVSGAGELLASGNASPDDMESFRKPEFKLFNGKGLVIVRPSTKAGSIEVKAEAENMNPSVLKLKTE
jgi:beta-galactosidase